jgi:NADPH-dependent curcumin reductase CurA
VRITLLNPSRARSFISLCPRQPLNSTGNSYDEARKELSQWLAEGKIQRKETIIRGGLAAAEQGLADLYKGINTG